MEENQLPYTITGDGGVHTGGLAKTHSGVSSTDSENPTTTAVTHNGSPPAPDVQFKQQVKLFSTVSLSSIFDLGSIVPLGYMMLQAFSLALLY
jgi:hypothetical protein